MKNTLIEIKNNLWGNNNRVGKAKNQFNFLEHKGKKIRTTRRKENPKKRG